MKLLGQLEKKLPTNEILEDEKLMFARGILKIPRGFAKFAMESPPLMLENKSHLYNAMNWD